MSELIHEHRVGKGDSLKKFRLMKNSDGKLYLHIDQRMLGYPIEVLVDDVEEFLRLVLDEQKGKPFDDWLEDHGHK